jgi:uncharacterized protein YpmS
MNKIFGFIAAIVISIEAECMRQDDTKMQTEKAQSTVSSDKQETAAHLQDDIYSYQTAIVSYKVKIEDLDNKIKQLDTTMRNNVIKFGTATPNFMPKWMFQNYPEFVKERKETQELLETAQAQLDALQKQEK